METSTEQTQRQCCHFATSAAKHLDYEHGRGTSFIKGEDGSFDNVTVGINKAARKEKVRKAIQESKRKARKAANRKSAKK